MLVDYSLAVSIICRRSRLLAMVDVVFSPSIVSGIHLVMGSDHLISFVSFHRDTVWDGRAIDKNFRLEKSIRARIRSNYDLL